MQSAKNYKKFIIVLMFLFCSAGQAKEFNEKFYQSQWCNRWNGKQEVRLIDLTRVDCVTKNYAVEFDFIKKWAECFGQATHYGDLTGKKPACILIIEKPADFIQYYKVMPTFKKHNVTLWYMKSPLFYQNLKR